MKNSVETPNQAPDDLQAAWLVTVLPALGPVSLHVHAFPCLIHLPVSN